MFQKPSDNAKGPGNRSGHIAGWLFFVGFIACYHQAGAQSFFYHQYQIPAHNSQATTSYFSFLTVYPDGTATARIRYADPYSGRSHLKQLDLRDSLLVTANGMVEDRKLLGASKWQTIMGDDTAFIPPAYV
ncbi:MAG TPA: hypothetical protein VK907_00075, partial [Phnomibacter sp.]|nr:hypothetical protein [Phnomibacter sp.]